MNFTVDDRHRSMRRFLMATLGSPPWRIRTERAAVADEELPVAVIELSSAVGTTRARRSIPQGNVEKVQSFGVTLYPARVEAATPAAQRLQAATLAELVDGAVTVGLSNADGSTFSPPLMLPVYDYAGVPVAGAAPRVGPAVPYGWMRVDDHSARALQDPDDPLWWTVQLDLRVSWEQGGRIRRPAPTSRAPHGTFRPTP